ncbi:hypothetical protein BRADI_1g37106v3 [Brachypodium distachyon]|uniref:Uncharacterized protein n=1 Tax=Brachypodium distachyon TaxID=15368 RepID=A0A0Q3JJS4_BRADI|nr:hypothetical protein BRADI_1g37106v3 [Brachypodium distachyon]
MASSARASRFLLLLHIPLFVAAVLMGGSVCQGARDFSRLPFPLPLPKKEPGSAGRGCTEAYRCGPGEPYTRPSVYPAPPPPYNGGTGQP